MIYQTSRWWIFGYEDEYQELWIKEHKKQTPMWRRQEIFNRTLSDGYHEVNGVKIPCTKLREVTAEEQDELNKIAQEQKEYQNGRDRYITQRVFDEIGYDEFLMFKSSGQFEIKQEVKHWTTTTKIPKSTLKL
jgi:hypothetical protein